jgi:thymidylate synthase
MQNLEFNYRLLIKEILAKGDVTTGRNGDTISIFGKQLEFKINKYFPLLTGRKIFYKGVLGEMAAFLRGPKNIKDFEK